jgi:MiaB-like tRNA modifying enzyme
MASFYLETFGCTFNKVDSELIRKILIKNGFKEASENEADFIILNTCGVVEKTERKILKKAIYFKKIGKKLILAGCLPLISPESCQKIADGIIGPNDILLLPKILKKILNGKKAQIISNRKIDKAKLNFFSIQKESVISIVPISEGCLSNCSYCATKNARKKLKSYSQKEILKNIKLSLKSGAKEIQLTSQDLAIYGLEKNKFLLPKLLKEISKIKGDFKIRLGMANPAFFKKNQKEIFEIMKSEKFYKFLHLPIQSGSNKVLIKMNRNYNKKEVLEIIKNFRKNFKDSILATDIIVGFPTETEKDFKETVNLIKKIKPEILHLFRYSKRKGTIAANYKDLPDRIKKERSRILNKVWLEICNQKNKKFVGRIFEVVITEKIGNQFLSRTNSYRPIILKEGKLGEKYLVKVNSFSPYYLIGEIISFLK